MYSDNDLDLVSSSIPIYTKDMLKPKTKKPKRGHFECSGCDAGRLSPSKTYITALVYDFDRVGPSFAFLYSRGDVHYTSPNTDPFTALLTTTMNWDWIYRDKERVRDSLVHVRGWWDVLRQGDFRHKNGIINLGDHVDMNDPDTDDGEVINPEFGIKLFIAPYAGMYRHWKDIEQIGADNEGHYSRTFVHPNSDRLAQASPPQWSRYNEKKEKTRKRTTRRPRTGINMTQRQRDEMIQGEVNARHAATERAMEEMTRTRGRRTTREAALQPPLAEGGRINPGAIRFTNGVPERVEEAAEIRFEVPTDPWAEQARAPNLHDIDNIGEGQ